jgi:hypothetical protein
MIGTHRGIVTQFLVGGRAAIMGVTFSGWGEPSFYIRVIFLFYFYEFYGFENFMNLTFRAYGYN